MLEKRYATKKIVNQITFDFHKLACLEPSLRPFVLILNCRTVCNFKDQKSLVTLTKVILKHCFGTQWTCPLQNLCPRVPARLNYLFWVNGQIGNQAKIDTVLDVGTGATLIYPLLGYKVFGWKFIATEIDLLSFKHSQKLIEMNNLQKYIDLRLVQPQKSENIQESQFFEGSILTGSLSFEDKVDVLICNPPFFQEHQQTLTTMTSREHHVEGGEYSFFFTLYRQSFGLPQIGYFTCLIGLKSNFEQIRSLLIEEHRQSYLQNVKFGEMYHGNTIRYIVMWKVHH